MAEPLKVNWPDSAWDISKSLKDERDAARTAAAAWKAVAKKWKGKAELACFDCFAFGILNPTVPSARAEYLALLRARGLLVAYLCNCGTEGDGDHARHGLYCKYRRKMEEEASA